VKPEIQAPVAENILGTLVHAVTMIEAAEILEKWANTYKAGFICPATVFSVMTAYRSREYRKLVNGSSLTIPDGMPLVWFLKIKGHQPTRVHGPDLMLEVCRRSPENNVRHFLLGGAEGQAEEVAQVLESQYPGIEIAGSISTPSGAWSIRDDLAAAEAIQKSGANLVWLGMGTPWQDEWSARYWSEIQGPVVGMGSAFDFISGRVPWAPKWVQPTGLQWLYRLIQEPKRLWSRYLVNNPLFIWLGLLQLIGIKKFSE